MKISIESVETGGKPAQGISISWPDGQFVLILTDNGFVGCGAFDLKVMNEFNMACAIAKGTPEKPLKVPDDLLGANIVAVSEKAAKMGVKEGMSGKEALKIIAST